jgi:hypothetical protein
MPLGLSRLLPRPWSALAALDQAWWEAWLGTVAPGHVEEIAYVAFRVPPNGRVAALLLDPDGEPRAFAKVLSRPMTPLQRAVARLLTSPLAPVQTPRLLGCGEFEGVPYQVLEPMPTGAHHALPLGSGIVPTIVDAFQERVMQMAMPADVDSSYTVCHGDFTPRNLRRARDGSNWLYDWDNLRWGPRLADELSYWCAEQAWQRCARLEKSAELVLRRLRSRGNDHEIAEAAEWPGAAKRTYRETEVHLRRAVGRLACGT